MPSHRVLVFTALAAVLGLAVTASLAVTADSDAEKPLRRTLEASGRVQRMVAPDLAVVRLAVEVRREEAEPAVAGASAALRRVIHAVRAAGASDLETLPVRLSQPPRSPNSDQLPPYRAQQAVRVRVHRPAHAGTIIDAAVRAGANRVDGPYFTLADPTAANREAEAAAVRDAQTTAEALARAADVRLGAPVSIRSGTRAQPPSPAQREASAVPPTEPGAVLISGTATVTYEVQTPR